MALMPCSECGRQVSTMAFTCPDCGAPVEAPPAAPRPAPTRASQPAGRRGLSNRLLLVGAVGMVVLGGAADATVRHFKERPAQVGASFPPVGKPGPGGELDLKQLQAGHRSSRDKFIGQMTEQMPGVGMAQRYAARAVDSLNDLRMDDRARKAEIAMRVTLADVAMQQEIDLAAYGGYTAKFSALGVKPRDGVDVEMTLEGQSYTATATHKDLPGMTCTTSGSSAEREAGQVFCTKSGS